MPHNLRGSDRQKRQVGQDRVRQRRPKRLQRNERSRWRAAGLRSAAQSNGRGLARPFTNRRSFCAVNYSAPIFLRASAAFLRTSSSLSLANSFSAGAADLAAIKRVILKEPAYQGKPKYCLLVFGKKADTHVWMVRDGNNFYVDANGNGDLTEPGEKVVAGRSPSFSFARIVERDGTRHQNLSVYCHNDGTLTMTLGQESARTQEYRGLCGKSVHGKRSPNRCRVTG